MPRKDWNHRADSNYADKAATIRFPNGMLGEMQFNEKGMLAAKDEAHPLYAEARKPEVEGTARAVELNEKQKAIYGRALGSDFWKTALGGDKSKAALTRLLRSARAGGRGIPSRILP